jgi:hypothetical protein
MIERLTLDIRRVGSRCTSQITRTGNHDALLRVRDFFPYNSYHNTGIQVFFLRLTVTCHASHGGHAGGRPLARAVRVTGRVTVAPAGGTAGAAAAQAGHPAGGPGGRRETDHRALALAGRSALTRTVSQAGGSEPQWRRTVTD